MTGSQNMRISLKLSGSTTRRTSTSAVKPQHKAGEQVTKPTFVDLYRMPNMPGADVLYRPNFVDTSTADSWYDQLAALDTWYQPTLTVHGKSVMQSRLIAAYATDPNLVVKYAGTTVQIHHPYPAVLRQIQELVEAELDVKFNHVLLNRYDDGGVSIGRHSDTKENNVIASLSLGAERTFIMRPKKEIKAEVVKWKPANGSLLVMQGETQLNWKHEIPRETKIQKGRISLTFRQLVQ